MKNILSVTLIFLILSCSYSPILDENVKYRNTPEEIVERDIDNCTQRAENYLKGRKMKRAGKAAVRKGAIGAFFGAIFGIFTGDIDRVVKGAATGAAVGGVVGAGSVAGQGSVTPDQIKQNYINNCLARKGYVVLGWD